MNSAINSTHGTAAGAAAPAVASAAHDQAPETVGDLAGLNSELPVIESGTPFQHLIDVDAGIGDTAADPVAVDQQLVAPDVAQAADDQALMAAMTAPLTPAMMSATTPAALPAMMMAMQAMRSDASGERSSTATTGAASLQATMASLSALPYGADATGGQVAGNASTVLPATLGEAATAVATLPVAAHATGAAGAQDPSSDSRNAATALATARGDGAAKTASQAQAPAVADARVASQAPTAATERSTPGASSAAIRDADAPVTTGVSASTGSAPAGTSRTSETLTLSGTPASWRQSLQEALGNRMQMQYGRGVEQATIRLEPPMLGRIDISIRHSGGSLEVNIAATHGEVLRQLNAVSETLRGDLAARQSGDVSVNISQSTRTQASAQANNAFQSGADGQGRGHKPGQEQDEATPGMGLYEASQADTLFTLN